jgi:hypothetical protein
MESLMRSKTWSMRSTRTSLSKTPKNDCNSLLSRLWIQTFVVGLEFAGYMTDSSCDSRKG